MDDVFCGPLAKNCLLNQRILILRAASELGTCHFVRREFFNTRTHIRVQLRLEFYALFFTMSVIEVEIFSNNIPKLFPQFSSPLPPTRILITIKRFRRLFEL